MVSGLQTVFFFKAKPVLFNGPFFVRTFVGTAEVSGFFVLNRLDVDFAPLVQGQRVCEVALFPSSEKLV
jgi:hypothetical protein